MSSAHVTSEPLEPAKMGEFSRIIGVFIEPKKTFEDIARRPTFLVPLVVMIVFMIGATAVFSQRIGYEKVMRDKIESNSRAQQLPADQREQSIQMWTKMGPLLGYGGSIVGPVIRTLAVAGVLMLFAVVMMSAQVSFRQMFSITTFAWLPSLIYSVLFAVVMFLKPADEFNIDNPLAFNPAALLDPTTTSKFVYSLTSSIDLFSLWTILLLAVGIKAAAGRKYSFSSGLFAVVLPWAIYVLGKSGFAAIFS